VSDISLKAKVITVLSDNKGYSIRKVKENLGIRFDIYPAYTTVATVLNRLEKEEKVFSIFISEKRTKKIYLLSKSTIKNETDSFLKKFITQFGDVGIKHLGNMLNTEISDGDYQQLRDKLGISDQIND
jgi:predicted transcriptional regulator